MAPGRDGKSMTRANFELVQFVMRQEVMLVNVSFSWQTLQGSVGGS